MSSYGSSHSGYIHPSQYQQYPPQPQQQHPQPPYPTTPGPPGPSQPQAFYPPPQPQQQQIYSTSPTAQYQQPLYSTSPGQQLAMPTGPMDPHHHHQQQQYQHRRSTSSTSSHQRPPFAQFASAPVAIPQAQHRHSTGGMYDQAPGYARRASHAEGKAEHVGNEWGLDDETLREYERRYRREKELEKRPTLGGSLIGLVKTLAGRRE